MTKLFEKIVYNIRHRGFWDCLFMAMYRIMQKVVPAECIIFYRKQPSRLISQNMDGQCINVRQATQEDMYELDTQEYDLSGFEDIELLHGHECYFAVAERVLGYIWVSHDAIYDDQVFDINLSVDQVYLYKAFTHPDYRGRGIYPTLLKQVCDQLFRKGVKVAYIATSVENVSSMRGIRKAGFKRMGTVYYVKIGRFQKLFLPQSIYALGNLS